MKVTFVEDKYTQPFALHGQQEGMHFFDTLPPTLALVFFSLVSLSEILVISVMKLKMWK